MARDGYRIFDAGILPAVFLGFLGYFAPHVAICLNDISEWPVARDS